MTSIPIYYVYAYLRKSNGTPYYIGKGKGNRAFSNRHSVSVPKDHSKIVFLERNLTNTGACAIERRMIAWYGRKDLGTGILLNRTAGGDGNHHQSPQSIASGISKRKYHKVSDNTREKISKANKGKIITEEHKNRLSQLKRGVPRPQYVKNKISASKKGKSVYGRPCKETTKDIYRNMFSKSITLISPEGVLTHIFGVTKFCRENNLHYAGIQKVLSGDYKQHKGWTKSEG